MAVGKLGVVDPSSYSNHHEIAVTDISLFLNVDFDSSVLVGRVELSCIRKVEEVKVLVLDSKDLDISKVTLLECGSALEYSISQPFKTFGSALIISIPDGPAGTTINVVIYYSTSNNASGLQWLTPEQTLGRKEPYMFSQFQAIHARSAVPCQDSPGVKFRYTAEITAPEQLTVLMSALHEGKPLPIDKNRNLTKFRQPVPIPSYLIAFAVGRLASQLIGPRCSVWAEPEALEASAYEFAETEKTLNAAIELCGNYEWQVYDLLVMPPSFPFGGMENPCLTFVTPTVLAGDRSLVDVVAHEISHSWSGNLVTTATFEHFWLNEGWTMFLERKILAKLHGEPNRHFHATLGLESLKETVEKTLGASSEFTKLVPSLNNTDPDDAFSVVPYEKGHSFLYYLEQLLGGEDQFNPFIKSYFSKFKYQSVTTEDFKHYVQTFFAHMPAVANIDWDGWFYNTGMPLIMPKYNTSLVNACERLANSWQADVNHTEEEFKSLSSIQISLFITKLLEGKPLSADSVHKMAELYQLDDLKNSEIRFRWIRLGLQARNPEFVSKALQFVNEQGRMKFVRPIYRDLYNWEEMRGKAIENYEKYKKNMMFVLASQLLKDLHIAE